MVIEEATKTMDPQTMWKVSWVKYSELYLPAICTQTWYVGTTNMRQNVLKKVGVGTSKLT